MFEFPEIPDDLSSLSDDQLAELESQAIAAANAVRESDEAPTDELVAKLAELAEGFERVQTALSARTEMVADRQNQFTSVLDRIRPATTDDGGDSADQDISGDSDDGQPVTVQNDDSTNAEPEPTTEPGLAASAAKPPAPSKAKPAPKSNLPARRVSSVPVPTKPPLASVAPPVEVLPPTPLRPEVSIVASADIPGVQAGARLGGLREVASAIVSRREGFGRIPINSPTENVVVASIHANMPSERTLRVGHDYDNIDRIRAVVAPEAITAAGGLCAPVQPYYDIMVLAGTSRPVRDGLPVFGADRGGVTLIPSPQINDAGTSSRSVADGATTNTSTTVTSATAAFSSTLDRGATISGTGIPAGAYIVSVTNATTVVISAAATATATGLTLTIVRQGSVGYITAAVDAAALNGTDAQIVAATKPCLHVSCPSPVTVNTAAISSCLQFGNFAARAYPKQVEAWLTYALAQWARRAETALLDRMSALSTQITAAKTYGLARQLPAQIIKAAAYYRNRNRSARDFPLRVMLPAWVIDAAACDLMHGSGYDPEFYSRAYRLFVEAFADANINPTWYIDTGTNKGQLINSGTKHTATALTGFPSTVVWYLFAEGTFIFLDGGSLDLGLVRDSSLNSLNNYRIFSETFEELFFAGVESLEGTSTVVADGTYAPTATAIGSF